VRTRALILASAASATAILGGWQLGAIGAVTAPVAQSTQTTGTTASTDASTSTSGTGTSSSGSTGATGSSGSTAGTGTSAAASSSSTDGTYTGSTVSTRFGDVQVQVTISGGAITDVTPLHLTDHDGRSVMISNQAAPILRDEVLQAQSASVYLVGGATYTSQAYLQSLQSALEQAGF
jgi:uncharacterized protein with FMN-binding domain